MCAVTRCCSLLVARLLHGSGCWFYRRGSSELSHSIPAVGETDVGQGAAAHIMQRSPFRAAQAPTGVPGCLHLPWSVPTRALSSPAGMRLHQCRVSGPRTSSWPRGRRTSDRPGWGPMRCAGSPPGGPTRRRPSSPPPCRCPGWRRGRAGRRGTARSCEGLLPRWIGVRRASGGPRLPPRRQRSNRDPDSTRRPICPTGAHGYRHSGYVR